jgi:hypothetical protein
VEDQSGAAIPKAKIVAINVGTNLEYSTETNGVGFYAVNVPPGKYRILASKDGFAQVVKPDVELHVQDDAGINFAMRVGSATESVTVEGGAPLVNTESAAVGTVIDRNFVGNLPLNGRNFQSLVLLSPGVTISAASYTTDLGQFSVNGQRASTNYFTVDGVSANIGSSPILGSATNMALAGSYPGLSALGGANNLVSEDALEEFKVQTSSYSADSGRQPGGQISVVTRSGTNAFHGSAFDYLRNDVLDARDWFNKAPTPKPALRQNQFGGTIGGPLSIPGLYSGRDRSFFFFSYEGQRIALPSVGTLTVPSLRLRALASSALKPVMAAFPLPTRPELTTTTGQPSGFAPFDFGVSNRGSSDAYSLRLDHTVNKKLTLFGRYNLSPSRNEGGSYQVTSIEAHTATVTLGANSAFSPTLNNELRFNWSRQGTPEVGSQRALNGSVPVDSSYLTSGYPGTGSVTFALNGLQAPLTIQGLFSDNVQRQINVVDNLSLVKGRHHFKFGVDIRRLSPTYASLDQHIYNFSNEAGIASGTADYLLAATFQAARPRFLNFSAFALDRWKVSPRLSLDLGLRWEINPSPIEADGHMPPLAVGIVGTDVTKATLAPPGTPLFHTSYKAFAPHLGIAYQLRKQSGYETVVRGGVGVYYDLGTSTASNAWPFSANKFVFGSAFLASTAIAAPPPIVLVSTLPTTSTVRGFAEDLKLPYTLQWNVSLEQALGSTQKVSLSYVASAARDLLITPFLNQGLAGPRPNPNFATISYSTNGTTSDYDSLQVQYQTRLTHGLQALANYTWSHAIDEVSNDIFSYNIERGNADFDVRHNFSAALTYNIPTVPLSGLRSILRDWSVSGLTHAQGGRPVDVRKLAVITVDGRQALPHPDVVPGQPLIIADPTVPGGRRFNAAAFVDPPSVPGFPGVPARDGNFGRNILRELAILQTDVSLGRNFSLTEALKLQFRWEAFNLFNHPMFGFNTFGADYSIPSTFGVFQQTLRSALGGTSAPNAGYNGLYQIGGPRSMQFSLRLSF